MGLYTFPVILFSILLAALPVRAAEPKLPSNYLPVPLIRQATDYSCGAAALLSTLYYWNAYDGMESSLYPLLATTPADGTEPAKLAEGARSFGLDAQVRENLSLEDLHASLKKGETVILDLQAWRTPGSTTPWSATWEDGHYVVLVGMDKSHLYVMDPSTPASYAFLPRAEFLERWHDYENRTGKRREYIHAGIVIRGKKSAGAYPAKLQRLD